MAQPPKEWTIRSSADIAGEVDRITEVFGGRAEAEFVVMRPAGTYRKGLPPVEKTNETA